MDFGRGKNEFCEWWGLLERLEQSVKRILSDLMNLVNDVYFETSCRGLVTDILDNLPNLVDTAV